MVPLSAICINWTGKPLSSEQMLVIQDAALDFESHTEDERLIFEHPLVDGMIECKGRMQHGMYRGTRYVATLDGQDGKPRTFEFLLTDFYEKSALRSAKCFWHMEPQEDGSVKGTRVESAPIKHTRTMSARRSRAN
jgi:hypothetical protein